MGCKLLMVELDGVPVRRAGDHLDLRDGQDGRDVDETRSFN